MKNKLFLFALALCFSSPIFAQNVGIGTAVPLEKLHVIGNVRVSNLAGVGTRLTGADANGTLVVVPAGVNGQVLTQTAGGPAWQPITAWLVGGNTLGATGNLGTISNNHVDLITNNIVRGRLSNLGEFFIGTTNTVIAGDLCNAVSNAAFAWAMNGYSNQNGSGVYGQITGGATLYGAVQGEYFGTNAQGTGVRGINGVNVAGTGFNACATGVTGDATTGGTYKFGVRGSAGTTTRTGGVLGYDYGIALGALGYYASNFVDYAVYGFGQAHTNGGAGGKQMEPGLGMTANDVGMDQPNTQIGMGIYGGVMGGWVRGMAYGMHVKGKRYSMYVDGYTFTNKPVSQLVTKTDGSRAATYSPTSMTSDIYSRGKAQLVNGEAFVSFESVFGQVISDPNDLTVTVSPTGNSNGIYVASTSGEGFTVRENNGGNSNVAFSWIAVATIKGNESIEVPEEVLSADFDGNMRGVMFNDNNTVDEPGSIWWDGSQVRFDKAPEKQIDSNGKNKLPDYVRGPASVGKQ